MTLSSRISQLRKAKGITQVELAAILGTTQSNIAHFESGRLEPNITMLILLVNTLGTTYEYLLEGKRSISTVSKTTKTTQRRKAQTT